MTAQHLLVTSAKWRFRRRIALGWIPSLLLSHAAYFFFSRIL